MTQNLLMRHTASGSNLQLAVKRRLTNVGECHTLMQKTNNVTENSLGLLTRS